jgi:hypothetical protein
MSFKEAYKAMKEGKAISNTEHPDDQWVWKDDKMIFQSGAGLSYPVQNMLCIEYLLD